MRIIENFDPLPLPVKEQKMTISVIVTVYNIEAYLERAVDSILQQSYRNLEVLLIDDGSTDRSGAICDHYSQKDSRVKVIHQKNGGAYAARNTGLSCATGQYLTFVDGDDWIDPGMYEALMSAMRQQEAELAVCRYRKIFGERREDASTKRAGVFEGQEILEKYLEEDDNWLIQTAPWNKLYKRSIIGELTFPKSIYEDMLYTIRLLNKPKRSVYLDTAYYNYVCDRGSSTTNMGIHEKTFQDLIPNLYSRSEFLREIGREDLALLHDYFLYKRLLLYYTKVHRGKDPHKKEYLSFLTQKLHDGKDRYEQIFSVPLANPNEYRKLKIFLASPFLYNITMWMNDRFVIPIKMKSRKHLESK